jgi:Predicted membrane protein
MGKQSISQRETQVAMGDSVGKQLEQTVSVDDNSLPSPQELAQYQQIDPNIAKFLMEISRKEQEHRHYMDSEKIKIVKRSERKEGMMNWWGMFFAFLSLLLFVGLTVFALYLDKPWFAGIFGGAAIISVISTFVEAGKKSTNRE